MWKRRKRYQFEQIILPYLNPLYTFALQMTRSSADAEDIVQETFVKAYRAFDQLQDRTRGKAWLMKIAINVYRDWYRKMMRAPLQISFEMLDPASFTLSFSEWSADPEQLVVTKTLEREVQLALDDLPPEFKMVILLADVEGFSYQEIAEILECPIGTVMSRLHRGRKLLRASLWDYAKRCGYVQE